MARGDAAAFRFTKCLRPGRPQPVGRIEPERILTGEHGFTIPGKPAHDRIYQAPEPFQPRPPEQADGTIDRGVCWGPEKDQLGDTRAKDVLDRIGPVRQGSVEARGQHCIDLTEAAKRGRCDQPGKRTVSRGKRLDMQILG